MCGYYKAIVNLCCSYSMPLKYRPTCKVIQDNHSFHGLLFLVIKIQETYKN